MNFYWNAFSGINLGIDIFISVTLFFYLNFFLRRSKHKLFPAILDFPYLIKLFYGVISYLLLLFILGILFRQTSFIRAHIVWTISTVIFPIYLFILVLKYRLKYLLIPIILILCFKYYAEVFEPNNLEIEKIQIYSKAVKNSIRIVHLSDLQTDGIKEMHFFARKEANDFNPHLVLFTGDVLNHSSIIPEVEFYLREFKSLHGNYFITGNVDGLLDIPKFAKQIGFKYFDAKSEIIQIEDRNIGLVGLGLQDYQNQELISNLSEKIKSSDYKILMSHYPDSILFLGDSFIDLIFAGHTHGGQVCLPWFGPIITLSNAPRKIATGGLNQYNKRKIVVSRGLGMEGHYAPRIRILARPHLILLEILPSE